MPSGWVCLMVPDRVIGWFQAMIGGRLSTRLVGGLGS
jgi:hypothetical protein